MKCGRVLVFVMGCCCAAPALAAGGASTISTAATCPAPIVALPVYPIDAALRGKSGEVVLEAAVDDCGRVNEVTIVKSSGREDYDQAAALYRKCRRNGETVRKLIDCLIGAVAIRLNMSVLHADADFATLARHTQLLAHASSVK